jgi:hypothetical protein
MITSCSFLRRLPCWLSSPSLRKAAAKEKAARAITGRLIPQLPTRRRFHRTADFGGAAAPKGDGSGPSSLGRLAGTFAASAIPKTTVLG